MTDGMDTATETAHPDWCERKAIAMEAELLAFAETERRTGLIFRKVRSPTNEMRADAYSRRASMAERAANLLQTYRYRLAKEPEVEG